MGISDSSAVLVVICEDRFGFARVVTQKRLELADCTCRFLDGGDISHILH